MKYVILLLFPCIFHAQSNQVGKAKSRGAVIAELNYSVNQTDTFYALTFDNFENQSRTEKRNIHFKGNGGAIPELYKICNSFFSPEFIKKSDYKVSFKLGDKVVLCSNYRLFGNTSIRFDTEADGYFILNEKQLKALFGVQ